MHAWIWVLGFGIWDLGFGIWDFLVPVRGHEKGCSAENVEFVESRYWIIVAWDHTACQRPSRFS